MLHSRWRFQKLVTNHVQLRNDTEHVEVNTIGEKKVPKLQHFFKRWGADAKREDCYEGVSEWQFVPARRRTGHGVNVGLHPSGHEVVVQLFIYNPEETTQNLVVSDSC